MQQILLDDLIQNKAISSEEYTQHLRFFYSPRTTAWMQEVKRLLLALYLLHPYKSWIPAFPAGMTSFVFLRVLRGEKKSSSCAD